MTVGLTLATSMLTPLFGQEAPSAPAGSGGFSLVMMIFVFLIAVFFLFILPGKSRDKQTKKLLDSIKPNDRVLTYGGVIGVEIGDLTSDIAPFKVRLTGQRLSFIAGSEEVAYMSDSTLFITQAHVTGKVTLGSYEIDTTDGLALKYVG